MSRTWLGRIRQLPSGRWQARHPDATSRDVPAVAKAGLDHALTFHGLRHVATTFMVEDGEHPRVTQQRLGHATARLSMELYAHVPDRADRDVAQRCRSASLRPTTLATRRSCQPSRSPDAMFRVLVAGTLGERGSGSAVLVTPRPHTEPSRDAGPNSPRSLRRRVIQRKRRPCRYSCFS